MYYLFDVNMFKLLIVLSININKSLDQFCCHLTRPQREYLFRLQ